MRTSAKVLPYFFVLLLIIITCSLGHWQLKRAEEKKERQIRMLVQANLPVQALHDMNGDKLFRRVSVTGRWLSTMMVYLDNRPNDKGQAGIEVIAPFCLEDNQKKSYQTEISAQLGEHVQIKADGTQRPRHINKIGKEASTAKRRDGWAQLVAQRSQTKNMLCDGLILLVKRGWLPRDLYQRTKIKPFHTSKKKLSFEGTVLPHFGRIYTFKSEENLQQARLRQNLTLEEFAQTFNIETYPFVLQQETESYDVANCSITQVNKEFQPPLTCPIISDNLLRVWPTIDHKINLHYGYAFQWFALAVLIAISTFYITWQSCVSGKRNMIFRNESE